MELVHETREQWLNAAIFEMRGRFEACGYSIPHDIRVACGWPVGSRGGKKILGQCFDKTASKSGTVEVFISPVTDAPLSVLGILAHELVHAAIGNEAGHGPEFKRACDAIGLEGKATEALPGPRMVNWLDDEVLPMLGGYPHASVDFSQRKKQGTRLIKLVCPETGYTVRTTQKWLEHGFPVSPAGCEMVLADNPEDSEE